MAVVANPSFTGTVTDTNATPIAFSNTGANTITNAATGAVVGLTINNNGAALTGDLLDIQLSGSTKASITNSGGLIATAITDSGITSGQCVQTSTGGLLTGTGSACGSGGAVSSVTAGASGNITSSPTTGAVVVDLVTNPTLTGTVTSSAATPFAASGTGSNTFTSAQAAGSSWIFNPTTTSTNTTTMFNFNNAGTSEFTIGSGGNIAATGTIAGTTETLSGASPQLTFSGTGGTQINSAQAAANSFNINATTTSTNTTSMFNVENNGTSEFEVGSGGNTLIPGTYTSPAQTPFSSTYTGGPTLLTFGQAVGSPVLFNTTQTNTSADMFGFENNGSQVWQVGFAGATQQTGAITTSAASPQLTFSGAGGTQINSSQAAGNSFTLNTTTTSTNTTTMFAVKNNGTNELTVGSGGNLVATGSGTFVGVAVGGALSTATTIANSGVQTNSNATTSALTMSGSGSGINFTQTGIATITSAAAATTNAVVINASTTHTGANLLTVNNNASNRAAVLWDGELEAAPTINSTNTLGQVPPCYTVAGAACGSTTHTVLGTCAFAAATTCTPTAFSSNAVFASATSYACAVSGGAATFATTGNLEIGSQSTTGIVINAGTSNSSTVTFTCTGT